jgi:hypothetical protein
MVRNPIMPLNNMMQSLNGNQGILEIKPNLQTYHNKPTKQKPNPTPKTTKEITNIFIQL